MKRFAVVGVLLALLCASACLAADVAFPPLTGRVVDQAGLLNADAQQKLTEELASEEVRTGNQVVVAIVKSLQGQPIEDYGYQLGRHWGIGQKEKNTGVILLVAPAEHQVRIEVGFGLEGALTDAKSGEIIRQVILPAFKQGQMSQGVVAGTRAILAVLDGNASSATDIVTQSANNGSLAQQEIAASSPSQLFGAGLFILFWIVLLIISMRRGGGFFFLPFMLGGQSWGGGSSGGGFSGGGGSFGGGGASGSW